MAVGYSFELSKQEEVEADFIIDIESFKIGGWFRRYFPYKGWAVYPEVGYGFIRSIDEVIVLLDDNKFTYTTEGQYFNVSLGFVALVTDVVGFFMSFDYSINFLNGERITSNGSVSSTDFGRFTRNEIGVTFGFQIFLDEFTF